MQHYTFLKNDVFILSKVATNIYKLIIKDAKRTYSEARETQYHITRRAADKATATNTRKRGETTSTNINDNAEMVGEIIFNPPFLKED